MKNLRVPIRVVLYKEDGDWIAHCLEFDLIGDGETKRAAIERLAQAISVQVEACLEYDNPRNLFKPADGKFFAMFAAGKDAAEGELHLKFGSVTIDESEAREYVDSETERGELASAH